MPRLAATALMVAAPFAVSDLVTPTAAAPVFNTPIEHVVVLMEEVCPRTVFLNCNAVLLFAAARLVSQRELRAQQLVDFDHRASSHLSQPCRRLPVAALRAATRC
jgi:hypothetical protein